MTGTSIIGLLPNEGKKEADLLLEKGDVVSLDITNNGVDDVYQLIVSSLLLIKDKKGKQNKLTKMCIYYLTNMPTICLAW